MEPKHHPIDKGKSLSPNPPFLEFHVVNFQWFLKQKHEMFSNKLGAFNDYESMKQASSKQVNQIVQKNHLYIDTLPKTNRS